MTTHTEHLKVVIVGHVDHGKSTVIGRLLADTHSLPEGKLEQVKESCRRNAKPFEYAFLLDALEEEQSQGITIDMARCFFSTEKRNYIIIDAPGHIEFLKNMVTGAARADAALLVIDAEEGIQENSMRHGYMLAMLGVQQISILINKFDLVEYSPKIYDNIVSNYTKFLRKLGIEALNFIPVSGRDGDNIATHSRKIPWYKGPTVLKQIDDFNKPLDSSEKPLRLPVQDVYKFTQQNDSRRIIAGTIDSGSISQGEQVVFWPSGKTSQVKSIEGFNVGKQQSIAAPYATGATLTTQIYIKSGEVMCRESDPQPIVGTRFRANLFWLGRLPMVKGKRYRLKIGSARVSVELAEIHNIIDASELSSVNDKPQLDRHDIGECVIETTRPIAVDLASNLEKTGRFVLVDDYEIAGGGVIINPVENHPSIIQEHVEKREYAWDQGFISSKDRSARFHHQGKFVVFTGLQETGKHHIAKQLEERLFHMHLNTYYIGISNVFEGLDSDLHNDTKEREEHIRRLGELSRIMTDAGLIVITAVEALDDIELEQLKILNSPNELLVINQGQTAYQNFHVDLNLPSTKDSREAIQQILEILNDQHIIPEYCI